MPKTCEKHFNIYAPCCPICLVEERDALREENRKLKKLLKDANRGAERNMHLSSMTTKRSSKLQKQLDDAAALIIELEKEIGEQARLNGMGSEREAKLMTQLEYAIKDRDKEWFQVIESILGFHPISMTEALDKGIEKIRRLTKKETP